MEVDPYMSMHMHTRRHLGLLYKRKHIGPPTHTHHKRRHLGLLGHIMGMSGKASIGTHNYRWQERLSALVRAA